MWRRAVIVTSTAIAELALRGARLRDLVPDLVSADDLAAPKPAPYVYLCACERMGLSPENTVALAGSPSGVRSADAAGLWVIGVNAGSVELEQSCGWPA